MRDSDDRIKDLEIRFAYQEDLLEKLGDVLREQYERIERLEASIKRLELASGEKAMGRLAGGREVS